MGDSDLIAVTVGQIAPFIGQMRTNFNRELLKERRKNFLVSCQDF